MIRPISAFSVCASILLIATALCPGRFQVAAQTTMPFDHVHIAVPDPAVAMAWYRDTLNVPQGLTPDRVVVGDIIVAFQKATAPVKPSAGSVVDHFALSVGDIAPVMARMSAAGAEVLQPLHEVAGLSRVAAVQDPWGTKIELVTGPQVRVQHVHLTVQNPDATLDWFQIMFGGARARLKGVLDGVRYGDLWILAEASGEQKPEIAGHAIDHLGWRPTCVDEKVAELKAMGAEIVSEPRQFNDLRFAFVRTVDGLRIELTQRPPNQIPAAARQ